MHDTRGDATKEEGTIKAEPLHLLGELRREVITTLVEAKNSGLTLFLKMSIALPDGKSADRAQNIVDTPDIETSAPVAPDLLSEGDERGLMTLF